MGNSLLTELSQIQTNDKAIQQRVSIQRDNMQRQMGYLHDTGQFPVKSENRNSAQYHIISWILISALVGSIVYGSLIKETKNN